MAPPLVLDIDGTLTRTGARRRPAPIDSRLIEPLRQWPEPIILATGKSLPYPVGLCHCIGIDQLVIAETGGITVVNDQLKRFVDQSIFSELIDELHVKGYLDSTDRFDDSNYWREAEIAVSRDRAYDPLVDIATTHGMEVLDSGYAYHIKHPDVSKGLALEWVSEMLGMALSECVAIGDSENDLSVFERVGRSFTLTNADESAKDAADEILEEGYADGTLTMLDRLRDDC